MAANAVDTAVWTDRRRNFWLVSLLLPMLPLAGVFGWHVSGGEAWLWLTPAVAYGLVPLLDQWLGEDPNNPPEELLPALERDTWYGWLTWLAVPAVWVTVCVAAWAAARGGMGPFGWLGLAISAGWSSGAGINAAHELGHRKGSPERWLARFALAPACYGHFVVEHVRGHHRDVATPADPASARCVALRAAAAAAAGGALRAPRTATQLELQPHRLEPVALPAATPLRPSRPPRTPLPVPAPPRRAAYVMQGSHPARRGGRLGQNAATDRALVHTGLVHTGEAVICDTFTAPGRQTSS